MYYRDWFVHLTNELPAGAAAPLAAWFKYLAKELDEIARREEQGYVRDTRSAYVEMIRDLKAELGPFIERDRKIMLRVRQGYTDDEIGQELGISARTVRRTVARVLDRHLPVAVPAITPPWRRTARKAMVACRPEPDGPTAQAEQVSTPAPGRPRSSQEPCADRSASKARAEPRPAQGTTPARHSWR